MFIFIIMETKICKNCGNEIKGRGIKFCSQTCNGTYNNKDRIKKVERECNNCGVITTNNYYCTPECNQIHKTQLRFEQIESGDITLDPRQYKKYLIHKHGAKCMRCGWCEVNPTSGNVPIELEHKDGDSSNNSLDNLELLCPNHHALTPTYKALNKGNGRHKRMERYNEGKSY